MNNDFLTDLKPVFQKMYVVLGKHDSTQFERLCPALSNLFSHMNYTSHLYLIAENLSKSMPQIERIQKGVMEFLKENLFARFHVHLIHTVPLTTMMEIGYYYNYYYQPLKRSIRAFDMEGYEHRETSRLVLLPLVVPGSEVDVTLLAGLFDKLKSSFLSALYLNTDTSFLAQDESLLLNVHKVYYGHNNSVEAAEIVSTLFSQDILEGLPPNVGSQTGLMTAPCPAALIISAQDGMVYSCMDDFFKKEGLANIYEEHVDTMMAKYDQRHKTNGNCLECRKQMVAWFSGLHLPQKM